MKKFEVISLKERLEKKDEIIVLPGVYDALSAG